MRSDRGFTLIEVAVVLVVIGILMGAILRGQEIIKNAKEKNFYTKIRFLASAQFTYLDRLGRYAGDTTSPPDGIIDNNATAWTELAAQQILQSTDQQHVFNGTFSYGRSAAQYPNNNYVSATRVPMWVAQAFDTKVDDGVGNTGNVRWQTVAGVAYSGDPNDSNNVYWWFDR